MPCARRRTTPRPAESCTDSGPWRRPSFGTPRDSNQPPATETSSPPVWRFRRCALVVAHFAAAPPPRPGDGKPNSHCDRTGLPTPAGCNRSVAGDRLTTSLPPKHFPVATNARSGSAPKPRLPSLARRPPRRCLAPVAVARRSACGHRSPHSDRARSPGERQRSESAGRSRRWKLITASVAAAAEPANAPRVVRFGETQVAWRWRNYSVGSGISNCVTEGGSVPATFLESSGYPRNSNCATAGGSGSATLLESPGYARNSDCAGRSRTLPITPRKSAPCTPNSDCATSQGSRLNGDGKRSGSGGCFCVPRSCIRRATK